MPSPTLATRSFDCELEWGDVGYALSHVGTWTLVAAQGELALVLDDDVDFAPDFADRLRAVLNGIAAFVAVSNTEQRRSSKRAPGGNARGGVSPTTLHDDRQ